jgi:hypothetical protein
MANNATFFRQSTVQVVTLAVASAQVANAFGATTGFIRIATPAVGAWYLVGTNPVVTVANGSYLPPNWVETIAVAPGQKIACIQPTAPAGTFNVTELDG